MAARVRSGAPEGRGEDGLVIDVGQTEREQLALCRDALRGALAWMQAGKFRQYVNPGDATGAEIAEAIVVWDKVRAAIAATGPR